MRIVKYFLIVILPIVIILGNFQFLIFNIKFYQKLYEKTGVYQSFPNPEIVANATNNLFDYFRGKNELDHNFFSNQAILHLTEVKNLLSFAQIFFFLSLVTSLVIASTLIIRGDYQMLLESLMVSSAATLITMSILGLGLFGAFDKLFSRFHQVLFNNNLWLFPPDDNLIKLFPSQFFALFAQKLAQNIMITSAILAAISFVLNKNLLFRRKTSQFKIKN